MNSNKLQWIQENFTKFRWIAKNASNFQKKKKKKNQVTSIECLRFQMLTWISTNSNHVQPN